MYSEIHLWIKGSATFSITFSACCCTGGTLCHLQSIIAEFTPSSFLFTHPVLEVSTYISFSMFICECTVFLPYSPCYTHSSYLSPLPLVPICRHDVLPSCSFFVKKTNCVYDNHTETFIATFPCTYVLYLE
jgi:hypothetical protein